MGTKARRELDRKIEDLEEQFAQKLKDEKSRAEEDGNNITSDEVIELKEKSADKIAKLRAKVEEDEELVRAKDCATMASERVEELEADVDIAKKRLQTAIGRGCPIKDSDV